MEGLVYKVSVYCDLKYSDLRYGGMAASEESKSIHVPNGQSLVLMRLVKSMLTPMALMNEI